METSEPTSVMLLREALSERLGRPACSRSSKGAHQQWVISDPSFGWIQQGSKGHPRSYRSGVRVIEGKVHFYNEHSRALAELFRKNLLTSPGSIVASATSTRDLRDSHRVCWSSRREAARSGGTTFSAQCQDIETPCWETFSTTVSDLAERLAQDLFPTLPSRGRRGGTASLAGTFFMLFLAEEKHLLGSPDDPKLFEVAQRIITSAWHLFSCFYPWEPLQARQSQLRRFMQARGIDKVCEYGRISGAAVTPCAGSDVEAAHIKPHSEGGSDRPWNGLWLCKRHHRETEGRLFGRRDLLDLSRVEVRFRL